MKKMIALMLAILLAVPLFAGCGEARTEIILMNWGEYLDPELIAQFEAENPDLKLTQKTTTSNKEMYVVCATEGSEIDICVPSDYLVEKMIKEDLLAEIDVSQLTNYEHIKTYAESRTFDPDSKYSVPYMIGTVGIVYNTTMVDDVVDSWDILWNEKYSKKLMMYSSIRDSLAVALCKLGYSINTTDKAQVEEAGQLLIEQKPLVLAYGTDNIKDSMIAGSCALAVDYSGAAAAAIAENPDLDYVVPKEGSNVWVDNLVIMKNSDKKEAAMRFIDFLCKPEVAAKNAEYIGYTPANTTAMDYVDQEMKENPAFVIEDGVLERCEYFTDLGDDLEIYNDVWMKVQTAG